MNSEKRKKGNPAWIKNGESPNPMGRPRKLFTMSRILDEVLQESSVTMDGKKILAKEAVARKLLALAMAGDVTALKYLYDRIDGTPIASVKNVDDDGNAIIPAIEVIFTNNAAD